MLIRSSARTVRFSLFLIVALAFAALLGACASNAHPGSFDISGSDDGGEAGLATEDGATSDGGSDDSGNILFAPDAGGGLDASGSLTISPANAVVNVTTGQAVTPLQFSAALNGSPVSVSWSLDRGELGTIGAMSGLLTPAGTLGGLGHVTATYGAVTATVPVTIFLHVTQSGASADAGTDAGGGLGGIGGVGGEGPGPNPGTTLTGVLNGTPKADSGLAWLYPYDKTVWPQGLLAPLLQWQVGAQGNYDAVYIHITEAAYEYKGYFGIPAGAPTPFQHHPIPQDAWYQATYSNGGEALKIELTFAHNGVAYGPITESWTVAQATLQGTVYYNSYGTALVHNSCCAMNGTDGGAPFGGATLAIKGGTPQSPTTAPVLIAGSATGNPTDPTGEDTGCRVCHTVAANGAALLTQRAWEVAPPDPTNLNYGETSLYGLTSGMADQLMPNSGGDSVYSWAAISPDGTFLFSNSWAGGPNSPPGEYLAANSQTPSTLYPIPPNAASYQTENLPSGLQAACPAFSPDGKHIAFNWSYDNNGGDGLSIGAIDLDLLPGGIANFSNLKKLFTPGQLNGNQEVAVWPSFLPSTTGSSADGGADAGADNFSVAFEVQVKSNGRDFGGTRATCDLDQAGCTEAATEIGSEGELWWVNNSGSEPLAYPLYALNGKTVNGNTVTSYLPTLAASLHTDDTVLNFEPTVNPVPSGGYAWVVFTSRRLYGNVATVNPYYSDPRFHDISETPTTKKLWVAAIDLNAAPGTDPSHPAFYLPAQELLAGNSRGFWVVNPCAKDGSSCETGDECCGGFCRPNGDAGALVCSTTAPSCSNISEKCTTTADCCEAAEGISCIGGFCSLSTPK